MKCSKVCKLICLLVVVGAVNWGLVGLGMLMGNDWNVVNMVLGSMPTVEAVLYVLIGVAGVMKVMCGMKGCKACGAGDM